MTASVTDLVEFREARDRARREAEQRKADEEAEAAAKLFVHRGQEHGFIPPDSE